MSNVPFSSIHDVVIDVGDDEAVDPAVRPEDAELLTVYQDVRMELNATGHNLTSVLINPRESVLEDLLNEFSTEQSAPLAYQSPLANPAAAAAMVASSSSRGSSKGSTRGGLMGISSSSHHSFSSAHSTSYLSSHHSGSSIAQAAAMYTVTPAENLQLERLIQRLHAVFRAYQAVHGFRDSDADADTQGSAGGGYSSHASSGGRGRTWSGLFPPAGSDGQLLLSRSDSTVADIITPGKKGEEAGHCSAPGEGRGKGRRGKGASSQQGQQGHPVHKSRRHKQAAEELRLCYREVPDLFFRPDFSLQSPEIFNQTLSIKQSGGAVAIAGASASAVADPGADLDSERTLDRKQRRPPVRGHEQGEKGQRGQGDKKLSYYLDLVEVALLRQIWLRSPAFFRALDDIRALQTQVSEATQQLLGARQHLRRAQQHGTVTTMQVPRLARRQRNAARLQDTLLCMQRVVQGRLAVLALLDAEDYLSAMELVAQTKAAFHGQLSQVRCMHQIGRQLDDIDNLVCEVMCNKFVSLAIQWEHDSTEVAATDAGSFGKNGGRSGDAAAADFGSRPTINSSDNRLKAAAGLEAQAETTLRELLRSLVLTERTQSALNMYKARLLEALRLIVRTCVMEYLTHFDPAVAYGDDQGGMGGDLDAQEGAATGVGGASDTPFAQRVREMSAENFLSCLSMCYEHVLHSVDKAAIFHEFMHRHLTAEASAAAAARAAVDGDKIGDGIDTPHCHPSSGIAMGAEVNGHAEGEERVGGGSDAARSTRGSASNSQGIIGTGAKARPPQPQQLHEESHRQALLQMISMSKACLGAACDLAQRSISQLINLRKETNSKLSPERMKFLWEISLNFVLRLEQVSGSTAYIIRQCLLAQTKSFLDYLHESCKGRLVVTLDNERWTQCDVSSERQQEIDRLSSGKAFLAPSTAASPGAAGAAGAVSTSMPKSLSMNSLANNFSTPDKSSFIATTSENGAGEVTGPGIAGSAVGVSTSVSGGAKRGSRDKESKPARVDGAEFKVVWSALLLTEVVLVYLEIAFNFSPITTDVITKIVELFRLFNNRSKQLVLGAQAIQSAARLKSISAKHLAITGQSLSLVVALLPHIRAALLAQIPAKHQLLLMELDRISHDFLEHHGQIVAKFVSIVGDFVDNSAARLRQVDWDRFQQQQGQGQCEYFEEVQRNVVALHRVLQATLPPAQVQDVFSRIFALLNRKIPAHFEEVMPSTQTGRQRILDEVTHLVSAFSRLKQIDASALTGSLEDTFRKRYAR